MWPSSAFFDGKLIALTIDERRTLNKMGDKSEAFCRQTLIVLANNPELLPANFDLPETQQDLASLDVLRPRLARLQKLFEKAEDSEMALGSDVMSAALEGYALLKVSGKGQGLESLRQGISARFARGGRTGGTPAPTTPTPSDRTIGHRNPMCRVLIPERGPFKGVCRGFCSTDGATDAQRG